ncbi:MAG TPA: hypothetical protein GXZ44_10240 [Fermentimonas caenicola]|nr:hypothetical protein [Fermentimonas caenicola]
MKNSILSKETYTEKDITDLIEQGLEESINIEYKSAKALSKKDKNAIEFNFDILELLMA